MSRQCHPELIFNWTESHQTRPAAAAAGFFCAAKQSEQACFHIARRTLPPPLPHSAGRFSGAQLTSVDEHRGLLGLAHTGPDAMLHCVTSGGSAGFLPETVVARVKTAIVPPDQSQKRPAGPFLLCVFTLRVARNGVLPNDCSRCPVSFRRSICGFVVRVWNERQAEPVQQSLGPACSRYAVFRTDPAVYRTASDP